MYEFPCPHCSIPLRVRDERFRNEVISCPECHQPVLIEESTSGLVGVVPPSQKKSSGGPPSGQVSRKGEAEPPVPLPGRSRRISPRMVAAFVAGGLIFLFIVLLSRQPKVNPGVSDVIQPPAGTDSGESIEEDPQMRPAPATAEADVQKEGQPSLENPTIREKLGSLFRMIEEMREHEEGVLLPAQIPSGPGWIGRLAEKHLPEQPVHWEAGWNAPVNDQFVRRSFPAVINPEVSRKVGEDNYPATHFIGVAGVGMDAHELPRDHPRAGIFSSRYPTRLSDIQDGLSNTMMIAGVSDGLGSWADPGGASMRSFAREPYVNGPDGFGTGQPDRMLVLMADGSVREISTKTEPVVVRRMAAMADGLSLDPQAVGDPVLMEERRSVSPAPLPPAAMTPPLEKVEPAPELPKLDIQPRLAQKIVLFEQSRPVPVKEILMDLQELVGVPFDLAEVPKEILERPMVYELRDTTVEQILREVTRSVGLTYQVRPAAIAIGPVR